MKKDIKIQHLIVNPENYRFDPVDNQADAIDLMLEEKGDEIYYLAGHILEHGLDKSKDSRVLEVKKDLYKVLDGNRRTTALKCLNDPGLIKNTTLRAKFLNLLKKNSNPPDSVNCFIYEREGDASEWIKLDHTGKNNGIGLDPWEPAGKERFDYKFGGKISPAMQLVSLFKEATKKPLSTKSLKISTVNRILSNPESRSYLGINIRNGKVIMTSLKKEVIDRLDTLFNKIITDDVAVKEVYHVPDSIKFMENLFDSKPKFSSKPTAVSITLKGSKQPKSIPRSSDRNVLIPKDCVLYITEKRINNMYHELRTVQLDLATNAIAILFRVFMETSLDCFGSKNGITFPQNTTISSKISTISGILEKHKIATARQLVNIRKVAAKGNTILSIQNFHEYVHSFTVQPTPIDLIYKWDNLQEFFEILWGELERKKIKKL